MHSLDRIYTALDDMGLHIDDHIDLTPGVNQRFEDISHHKRNKNVGIYITQSGRGAIIRNWASGDTPVYVALSGRALTKQERIRLAEREALEKRKRIRNENRFRHFWENSCNRKVDPNHGYLVRKGIAPLYCRQYKEYLVLPAFSTDYSITGIQLIHAKPLVSKRFMRGSRYRGSFLALGDRPTKVVRFVEGYATGVSVHMATGDYTVVCFSSHNIQYAMQSLLPFVSQKKLIICCDQDEAGRKSATRAARSIGAVTILAPLDLENQVRPTVTDFNDIHKRYGIYELMDQMSRHLWI